MKPGRIVVALIAVAAVIVLILAGGDGDGGKVAAHHVRAPANPPAGAVVVPFVYSPEKQELLEPLINEFNQKGVEVGGAPVFIQGSVVASGEAERKIAAGDLKPVAWSPASTLWGRLLDHEAGRQLTPYEGSSIVRTPLVIAMWEPMARALGWPDKEIGFDDILALSRASDGWASVGHPEFGDFKLVHTNPDFSTSGLEAVVAEYYAAIGKQRGLSDTDIRAARQTVRDVERSIVHYGDTTLFVADQMRKEGPSYASAVAMEEVTLLDFNENRGGQPKLVAIYPKEGTFFSDNPFFILNGNWVTPEQRAGARAFQSFLTDRITPELAAQHGFRPADLTKEPVEPITPENGVDPTQPKARLEVPFPRVLAAIREAWRRDRKPANVMLVVQRSASMHEAHRLDRAKKGVAAFLEQLQPTDRVGLTDFNDRVKELVPIGPLGQNRVQIEQATTGLVPKGGSALLDATSQAFQTVASGAGSDHINSVVVLTDGDDRDSALTLGDVTKELSDQTNSATQVRVFTVGYSPDAPGAVEALKGIAESSGGQYYEGGTANTELLYRSISSFF
jgi:Ca-activated chloride channel family protein